MTKDGLSRLVASYGSDLRKAILDELWTESELGNHEPLEMTKSKLRSKLESHALKVDEGTIDELWATLGLVARRNVT